MYESFYGFNAKPFQIKPDPSFFYGSKGHKRAMAYLEYGLSQGEGFIVLTGEVGAGKTTLMRNLFRRLESEKIIAIQIVSTHIDSKDILKLVAAAFGLKYADVSKAVLLLNLEQFLRQCDQQGKRVLLVVDEAQNLSSETLEELRMLSNFQTDEASLLQTFLLGQPEFKRTLLHQNMQQLRQRVIATYHLGPLDEQETKAYIEHRLTTAGWKNDPVIDEDAYRLIYKYTGGIPRKINLLCDRMLMMGCLEELHHFGKKDVNEVIDDFEQEFDANQLVSDYKSEHSSVDSLQVSSEKIDLEKMESRLIRMEKSVLFVLDLLKQNISFGSVKDHHLKRDKS
ncbi:XrtA/PEP-CTERM system-associated ATPase [Nitrosomonas aestuarii]|uniref:XrtA/PEP-CTERM system-associated ATPase n=1 Tax=Nitrosomonas aestuarii TaxID=52441 RepID=UPI000D3061C6|nr:XrtA/PEP-CTERM system-associated ATPase [Nitrosomonas aestuarii]PTN11416.1 putative secretion ATPase (PEP-CTERM system associated) [Nitrosomonas aestuarii]